MSAPPDERSETLKMQISLTYSAVDGARVRRTFKTLKGAKAFAQNWVGAHPEIGSHYAVSGDGIGKITANGVALSELFPDNVITYDDIAGSEQAHYEACQENAAEARRNAEAYRAKGAEWMHVRHAGCTCSDMQLSKIGCDCPDAFPF